MSAGPVAPIAMADSSYEGGPSLPTSVDAVTDAVERWDGNQVPIVNAATWPGDLPGILPYVN